jgi:hypothetical protein
VTNLHEAAAAVGVDVVMVKEKASTNAAAGITKRKEPIDSVITIKREGKFLERIIIFMGSRVFTIIDVSHPDPPISFMRHIMIRTYRPMNIQC